MIFFLSVVFCLRAYHCSLRQWQQIRMA